MGKHDYSDIQSNQLIREAIRRIALHGVVNRQTGGVYGAGKTVGYVAKIHTDGDLAGTVDVQEYTQSAVDEDGDMQIGYHEGVYLSAIQDNAKGMVVIPKLYSDVVIAEDTDSGHEYVIMFSHVDVIQLDSHETIRVGVKEREPFDENDEDSPDVDELEETGVFSNTTYKKDSVVTEIQGKKDDASSHVVQTIDSTQISQVVGDNATQVLTDGKGHHIVHDKAKLELGDDESTVEHGGSKVKVVDGTVYVGSDSGTDDAVLGSVLADVLMDLLNYLSQVKTTTQLGPQPFLNMAQFIAMKTKIQSYKEAHSGFLTQKVQIEK